MQFLSTTAVCALSLGALAAPFHKRQTEAVTDVVSIVSGLKASVDVYLQAINSTVSDLPISANVTISNTTAVEIAVDISAITDLIIDVTEVLEVALGGAVTTVEGTVSATVSAVEGTVSGTVSAVEDTAKSILPPRQVGGIVGTVEKVASDPVNTVLGTTGGAAGTVEHVAGGILRRQIDESAVLADVAALVEEITFTLKPIVAIVPLGAIEGKVVALAASVEGLVVSLDKIVSGLLVTVEAIVPVTSLAKSLGL